MATNTEVASAAVTLETMADSLTETLAGKSVSVLSFVDALIDLALREGSVHCRFKSPEILTVERANGEILDLSTSRARGKLRAACANLAVRSQSQHGAYDVYGGSGIIRVNHQTAERVTARWTNTTDCQEFSLTRIDSKLELA